MDDGTNPDHVAKGLSGGQMVLLFLAGAAVCALFFAAGFIVGFNEKSSTAAPVTEKLAESSDIPPVVTQDPPRQPGESSRRAKEDKSAAGQGNPEPLRPQPRTSPTADVADDQTKPGMEPRLPPAVMPVKGTSTAAASGGAAHGTPAGPSASGMMIQVAATGTKVDAEKMVKALHTLSYPVVLVTPEQAHSGDNLYRVQVGPYPSRETAEKIKARLIQDGFKQPFIKH
jgi:rare lipoprotein A